MWAIPVALLVATSASAVDYHGQLYNTDIFAPGPNNPWYTGGYNLINSTTIQTLICCPPLPPVSWVLRNSNTGLLAQELTLSSNQVGDFTGPENPPINSAQAGSGYVLCSVLTEDPSQVFGCSGAFEILDGAISPPIVTDGPEVSGGGRSTSASSSDEPMVTVPVSSVSSGSVTASLPVVSETTEPASPLAPSQTNEQSQTATGSRSAASAASISASRSASATSSGASVSPSPSKSSGDDRASPVIGLVAVAAAALALL